MMDSKKLYRLFSPCILVKGYSRSLIVDLNRHGIFYIPNEFHDVLKYGQRHTWEELIQKYGEENKMLLEEYYQHLRRHELIFSVNRKESARFPSFSMEWDFPSYCSNAILDIDLRKKNSVELAIQKLSEVNCYHLQIRFLATYSFDEIRFLLNLTQDMSFNTVQLSLKYVDGIEIFCDDIFDNYWKLAKVEVFDAPFDKIIPKMANICLLNYYKDKTLNVNQCGCVSTKYFVVETNHFTESQCHNTCLNRKICIDAEGNIKNCPAMAKSYGNIKDTTLEETINKPGFKDLWYICKDQIDVCKDCEFRHLCTDCRAFIKDPENIYSQPAKCTYNPYICKWQGEEGYVPVEKCGTYSRETGFVPDKKRIAELNKRIWGEE